MVGIIIDVDVGNNLIIQFGHFIDKLLLHFLLCNVNSIEESNHIAALRILMEPVVCFTPESSSVIAPAEEFKVDIRLSGSNAVQYPGPPQGPADMAAIFGVHRGRRKIVDSLLIGVPQPGDSRGSRGLITFHHILCHIDLALDAPLRRSRLGKIGQFLFIKLPDPFLGQLFFCYIYKNTVEILIAIITGQELSLQ